MGNITAVGFNTHSVDGELASMDADLERLATLGVDAVELAVTSLDLIAGGRIIEERAARLVEMTSRYPFRYTVHGLVSSNFMDPLTLPYQLAAAKALVEINARIGAKILVHHSGEVCASQFQDFAGADARERDALAELAEFAAQHDVRIALENIFTTKPGQYRQTPAQVAQTVKTVNHPNLVALIDFSHAYIECTYKGLNFLDQLRAMAPVAGHLHVHDSFGKPIGNYTPYFAQEATALGLGDLHMPIGWGDIAWEAIFAELEFLPDTVLMMEINDRYAAEQPACLARARALAQL